MTHRIVRLPSFLKDIAIGCEFAGTVKLQLLAQPFALVNRFRFTREEHQPPQPAQHRDEGDGDQNAAFLPHPGMMAPSLDQSNELRP